MKPNRYNNHIFHITAILAVLMAWMMPAKAQETDYSGTYYIGTNGYNPSAPANNYYLCPTEGWIYYQPTNNWSTDGTTYPNPFLTTYKCKTNAYHSGDPSNAVWIIEKHPTEDYYYIKHKSDGKYMVSNGQISGTTNANRMRVHIETVAQADLDDKALFSIKTYSQTLNNVVCSYLVISPKSEDGWNQATVNNVLTWCKWYTVNNGNKDALGGSGSNGGPSGHTATGGIIGLYTENDNNAQFYLEDLFTRPTITCNASNQIEITAAQSGTVTIKYTTNGTTPSAINGETYTTPFDPGEGEITIKAITIGTDWVSNVATFTVHKRLIQNQNNAWNTDDFHFYMIPGDDDANNVTKANTTSLFRPSMEWSFQSASFEKGIQYYYIINNANSKYLCYDATNLVYLEDFGSGGNKFKFFMVESSTYSGTFNILPYGQDILLCKQNGNASADNIYTVANNTNNAASGNTRWKFVLPADLDTEAPFTSSDPLTHSYSYYKIANIGASGHYIVPGTPNATTSNSASDDMNWYFEVAQAANASDWLTYYHIRNAVTGDYLYFTKDDNNDGACLEMHSTIDVGNADRYRFTWAKTADATPNYYIIPKLLKDKSLNEFSTLRRNSGTLQSNLTRSAGNYAWTFEASTYICATPTITWSAGDNGYVITSTESDATIYYRIGEGTLSPTSGTPYTTAISVADLGVETATIRAIAFRNGSDVSTEVTQTVNRVATPVITPLTDGTVEITCATPEASIYYEMGANPSDPTTSSTSYSSPIEDAAGLYIKAIAVKGGMINSAVATSAQITFSCATPVIRKTSATTFTIECSFPTSGVTIRYNIGENHGVPADPTPASGTIYNGAVTFTQSDLPFTVKAIAYASNYSNSVVATQEITADLTLVGGYYEITNDTDFATFVSMVNENTENAGAKYKITADINASGVGVIDQYTFTGELTSVAKSDGSFPVVSNLGHAIFNTLDDGTVKNVILDNVNIISGTNVGAICNEATGDSRIYNCGVLGGSVGGSGYVGGLVGLLDGTSHVVNCYSFANITGGSNVGGIVGYNNGNTYWTTSALHVETMVMNCMFYGDITGGSTVSPVYGGNNINNVYVDDASNIGLNTFNYYAYDELQTAAITTDKYNCALAVEERYLHRFEFYRLLLNSNKKLAAIYASTTSTTVQPEEMAKWVLETADRTITNPQPYPILKQPGRYYPSIINMDAAHADQITLDENGQIPEASRNKGGKLGTLSVTISESNTTPGGQTKPTGATVATTSLTLVRTDKDFDRYNYNYDKVQLPYYNEVGSNNYTGNRVVTGWKITSITPPFANDPYTSSNYPSSGIRDYPDHNYADRKSSNKDLYSVSGRVFSQGAYFDVPYGVTSITIEPYWAKCAYISDPNYDAVYSSDYSTKKNVTKIGTQVGSGATFNNDATQLIKTSVSDALSAISSPGSTVYDNAVVLVGNLHLNNVPSGGTTPFTMMSVDMDNDHEPDYSLIYHHKGRTAIAPIRYDFLPIPGTAQAQKPNGAELICNFTIFKTKGWFESTNTSLFYTSQVEYENLKDIGNKADAPLILQGGVIEQFVSTQMDTVKGKTIYVHLGGNVWIHEFGMGTHSDGSYSTPHVPVSVTGGDYDGFYLTGTYNANAHVRDDNAECYISGGRFGEVAGAAQEQIGSTNSATNGNVHWQIYNADITSFFGGGVNDAKPVQGNVTTEIYNSHVNLFCGGPKFGNMASGKKVTTTAEGCVFDKYYGAGYGGNSYSRKKYYDKAGNPNWATLNGYYTGDKGKYYDGATTQSSQNGGGTNYGYKGPGVATDFDYEFFVWSSGTVGVRFFVKFASFSLAQCNDVESNLDQCIINENFYGAGSLGKVTGSVTSVLEDCTVKGNVFGAGYSATLPKIPVRSAGFESGHNPNFNNSSGMFEQGIFSDTTHYTWKQVDSYPANGGAGFDGTQVKTTINLSKTNLGSVGGHVTLTLKGNTSVGTFDGSGALTSGGNVFGGGDESVANNNTSVILQGNTHVGGNVYGGGNNGAVNGNSEVIIQDTPEP